MSKFIDRDNPLVSDVINVLESNYDIILEEYKESTTKPDRVLNEDNFYSLLWYFCLYKVEILALYVFHQRWLGKVIDPWDKLDINLFPKTYAVVNGLNIHDIFISQLSANTRDMPEHRESEGIVRIHLPLIVPEGDIGFSVYGEIIKWVEGRCCAFRISDPHYVWNHTNIDRVNLLVDVLG